MLKTTAEVKDVHWNVYGCSGGSLKGMNLKMQLFQNVFFSVQTSSAKVKHTIQFKQHF